VTQPHTFLFREDMRSLTKKKPEYFAVQLQHKDIDGILDLMKSSLLDRNPWQAQTPLL